MVEVGYVWSSQKKMTPAQIQRLIKRMNRSYERLPKIEEVAETTKKNENKGAEQQLEKFLNS